MVLRLRDPARGLLPLLAALALGALGNAPRAFAQITTLQDIPEVVEEEEPFPFIIYGITLVGGLGTYDMQEMNEAIEILNRDITQPGVAFEAFSGGASMGGGARAILKERLVVQADWERLYARHHIGGITAQSEISIPAEAYVATVAWDLLTKRRAGFGLAVGYGYYESRVEQLIKETNIADEETTLGTIKVDGKAWGPHIGAYLEASILGHVWANFFAGYRSVHMDDVSISGLDELQDPELAQSRSIAAPMAEMDAEGLAVLRGGGRSLDWSGFMGRMALTWYFNVPVD